MNKVSKTLKVYISDINRLAERINDTDGKPSMIDVDILMDATREMYDYLYSLRLQKVNDTLETTDEEPLHQAELNTTPKQEAEPIVVTEPVSVQETAPVSEAATEPLPEPTPVSAQEIVSPLFMDTDSKPYFADEKVSDNFASTDTNEPSIEEIEGEDNDLLFSENDGSDKEQTESHRQQPLTLWDKLQENSSPTIAEKQSKQTEKKTPTQSSLFDFLTKASESEPAPKRTLAESLGDKKSPYSGLATSNNKITDLRTVININDKFSIMNELFNHNMKAYNDFILRLNEIEDRSEALAFVESIARQYEWDNNSAAAKTFYIIFDRKF